MSTETHTAPLRVIQIPQTHPDAGRDSAEICTANRISTGVQCSASEVTAAGEQPGAHGGPREGHSSLLHPLPSKTIPGAPWELEP